MDLGKQDTVFASIQSAPVADCRKYRFATDKGPILAVQDKEGGVSNVSGGGDCIKGTAMWQKGVEPHGRREESPTCSVDPAVGSRYLESPIAGVERGDTGGQEYEIPLVQAAARTSLKPACQVAMEVGLPQGEDKQPGKEKKKVGRPRKKELKVTTKKLLPRPAVMYQDYAHLYAKTSVASTWVQPDQADSRTVHSPAASTPSTAEEDSKGESLNPEHKKGRKADGTSKQRRKKVAGQVPPNWQGPPLYLGMPHPYIQQGPYPPSMHASPYPPFFPPLLPTAGAAGPPFHMPAQPPHPGASGNIQLQPPSQSYQPIHPPPHMMLYPYMHRPFQGSMNVRSPMYTDLFQQLQQVSSYFAELVPNLCKVCQATAVQLAPPPYQAVFFSNEKQNEAVSTDDKQPQRKRQKGSISQNDIAGANEVGVMVHAPREFLSKKVQKDGTVSVLPSLKEHVFYLPANGDEILEQQKVIGGKRKRPVIYIKWQAFERLGRHAVDLDILVKESSRLRDLKKRKLELQETLEEQGQEIKRLKCEIATRDERIQKLIMDSGCIGHADPKKQVFRGDDSIKPQQDEHYSVGKFTGNSTCRACGNQLLGMPQANEAAATLRVPERCLCMTQAGNTTGDKVKQLGPGSEGCSPQASALKAPNSTYSSSSPKLSRTDKQRKYNTMAKDMLKRQQCVSNGIVVFEACPAGKCKAREAQGSADLQDRNIITEDYPSAGRTVVSPDISCHRDSGTSASKDGNLQRQTSGLPRLSLQLPYGHGEEGCPLSYTTQEVPSGRYQHGQMSGHPHQGSLLDYNQLDKHHRVEGLMGHHYVVEQGQQLDIQQEESKGYHMKQPHPMQQHVGVVGYRFNQRLAQEERHPQEVQRSLSQDLQQPRTLVAQEPHQQLQPSPDLSAQEQRSRVERDQSRSSSIDFCQAQLPDGD